MPVVFVIARDWILRALVRAELRERDIDARGMDSPDDASQPLASGESPAAIVLEATADLVSHPGVRRLISSVPTVLIASRTEKIPLLSKETGGTEHRPSPPYVGVVLYRPVLVRDIVSRVMEYIRESQAA